MKKILLFFAICLLGISNDFYGQATCDDTDITITSGVNGGTETQHAQNTLVTQSGSSIVIEGNANVEYKAGTSITLNPGFKVEVGSQFKALIEDCTPSQDTNLFITEWDFTSGTITIPANSSGGYNFDIDWGNNGTWDVIGATGVETYTSTPMSTIQVAIRGDLPRINFKNGTVANAEKIIDIVQWGTIVWSNMTTAFYGCKNLDMSATDTPDLSNVSSLREMFYNCSVFNGASISDWKVDNVTDLSGMFSGTDEFNQSLNGWIVDNVTDMSGMFSKAKKFDQPLDTWITTNVTDMSHMFVNAIVFNRPLNTWDVKNVQNMFCMFQATNFNQSLDSWDVRKVTNMLLMFSLTQLSQLNYETTLNAWAALDNLTPGLSSGVSLGADGQEYCDSSGRDILTNSSGPNWTITGDVDLCARPLSTEDVVKEEFNLYPNPVGEKIFLTSLSSLKNNYRIQITDVAGRVVLRKENQTEIDVSNLKSGVYFLQIIGENKVTKKFLKL